VSRLKLSIVIVALAVSRVIGRAPSIAFRFARRKRRTRHSQDRKLSRVFGRTIAAA
jgi:hypothetical protein